MRFTVRRTAAAAAAGAALLVLSACGQSAVESSGPAGGEPGTLVFAAVPSEESTSLQQSYQSVITCEVGEEGGWGYVSVDDAFYNGVRRVCDITKAESCTSLG